MNELSMELHLNSNKHLYEQIYEHIRNEIQGGKLLHNEKLPSTRALAEYLQISRSTVDLAYEQLVSEGYAESRPYRGYFVSRVEELVRIPVRGKSAETKSVQKEDTFSYNFSPNGIEMNAFPFATWRKISKNNLNDDQKKLFQLGAPRGDAELRTTIGRYLHSSRGVVCQEDQIIIGAGNDYLLMLLRYILGNDIHIAMENPTYMRAYRIFQSFEYQISGIPMDEHGIDMKELAKSDATVAYIMPSHQYPTGIVMPIGRRRELLKWAGEAEERYLIEDDYDSEFRYRGKPIPALQASDQEDKVIYMGTFSKSIAPAIRVSYMVLPQKLLEIYEKECSFFASTVSRLDQSILDEFIREGYFERYLNKMRKIYRGKQEKVINELKGFSGKFRISGENAGLHLLLEYKGKDTEEELIKMAANYGVKVYGLRDSFMDVTDQRKDIEKRYRPTILLGYGGLSEDEIVSGIALLKQAWSIR